MSESREDPKHERKAIDLAQQRYKRLVLGAFDRLKHRANIEAKEKRAEIERIARKRM